MNDNFERQFATLDDFRAAGRSAGAELARKQIVGLATIVGNGGSTDHHNQAATASTEAIVAAVVGAQASYLASGASEQQAAAYREAAFDELSRRLASYLSAIEI